jgi:amino acid adenylation domain-containing protein/thioester reductase-like protein
LFHFLHNQNGGDAYVLPTLISVPTPDVFERLVLALQRVIDRHDIMRTSVFWDDLPQAVQVVWRHVTLPVKEMTLNPDSDPLVELRKAMTPQRQRIDLRTAPMMQLEVAKDPSSPRLYVLLKLHHLVCDHESLDIMLTEVMAHIEGVGESLPAPAPYRNHVAQALAHARMHDAREFFSSKLGDVTEGTTAFGLTDVYGDGTRIDEARKPLDAGLVRRARLQSRQLGVSVAALFHSAWALVVAHASGRDDVVFGSVLLGRLQVAAGAQRILGMFINTLPLRLRLRNLTITELAVLTQGELAELLSHEQASLAVAQRCSGMAPGLPLFNTLLNYLHGAPNRAPEQALMGCGIEMLSSPEWTNYPITLSVEDDAERITLTVTADRRVGPTLIIEYMQEAMEQVVDALESRPDVRAMDLSVMSVRERQQLIETFNAAKVTHTGDQLIQVLFEQQVAREPESIAVVCAGRRMTYAELNARSNQLARHLLANGVQAGNFVGIFLERSLESIVSVLATIKMGGAYVPLDPSYPIERIRFMLDDSKPQALITHADAAKLLGVNVDVLILLESDWDVISKQDTTDLDANALGIEPSDLAYLIYTSGSTGQPKGVMVEHRNVVHLWVGLNDAVYEHNPCRRVSVNAALSFDASVQQWIQLLSGRTLYVLREQLRQDPNELMRYIAREQLEGLDCTPAQLTTLVDVGLLVSERSPLQVVLVGGEAIGEDLWGKLRSCKSIEFYNVYGPTECTVDSTFAVVRESADLGVDRGPHIGRPIANARVYILNPDRALSPMGIVGEIFIGGAGVSRGYLGRPELTKSRFVPDPYCADPEGRMYQTGDLGRWRVDGTIEYLGRNDSQVKIHGYRVELGEIEACLNRHDGLKQSVVTVVRDHLGQARLVAYVILKSSKVTNGAVSADALRAYAKKILPGYMIPSSFVIVERFPLTSNGKLDRAALPVPEATDDPGRQVEPPHGKTEEILAGIWLGILGVERISRDDSFFEVGGHSISALKALLAINRAFGCTVTVADLYATPTIREMATRIRGSKIADELVDLRKEAVLDPAIARHDGTLRVPATAVLLTGSTGFVGRFLLARLLEDTGATIYCLVRSKSTVQAATRVRSTLREWGLWKDRYERRISAIPGDLGLPRLGLDEKTYRELSENVDSIYHCGTSMNHLESYRMAKPPNVGGTAELLLLASRERPKVFNYISTLSVYDTLELGGPRTVVEGTVTDHERHTISAGYVASKWVSEKMCLTAGERGIPCNIFRLGLVWADEQLGRYDELQREDRVFRSCLMSGYGVEHYKYGMAPTPVDYVAKAIVVLAEQNYGGKGIFHISRPGRGSQNTFERCNEIAGTSLELLPLYEWIGAMSRLHSQGHSLPVVPLIEYAFSMDEDSFYRAEREHDLNSDKVKFDCSQTIYQLEKAGVVTTTTDDELVTQYVKNLISQIEGEQGEAGHSGARGIGKRAYS